MSRLLVSTCVALGTIGVLAVSWSDADARPAQGAPRGFTVKSVTPSRGQETLADLSDPGVNRVVTVRFSAAVDRSDLLDDDNLVNGLSGKVEFRDDAYAPVPATVRVRANVLTIQPLDESLGVLAPGRYTLTLKSSIHSAAGARLGSDYTTTFTVGSDVYPPVLVGASPSAGETDVSRRATIVVSFDERIDRASARAAVRLEDRSTDPPTPIRARVHLARQGSELVVRPRALRGLPGGRQIALVIAGEGDSPAPAMLTDATGHAFTRDAGPQWTADASVPTLFHSPDGDFDDASGEYTLTFRTRGAEPRAR